MTGGSGAGYLGVGLYTVPEASRYVGVHSSLLRRWIRTYTYKAAGGVEYKHTPVIRRHFGEEGPITFLELIELHFIWLFRKEQLSMQYIRAAAKTAQDLFHTSYPFSVKRFDTDGKRIFATLEDHPQVAGSKRIIEELWRGQIVFETIVRPFFKKLEYAGRAEALRFWPLDQPGRVVLDPERNFGKPIDSETGVPTRALFDAVVKAKQPARTVAKWFGVPLAAVRASIPCLRWLDVRL